ncbi:hypothetical protein JCM10212_002909 [Sporobolomyces blumeae]
MDTASFEGGVVGAASGSTRRASAIYVAHPTASGLLVDSPLAAAPDPNQLFSRIRISSPACSPTNTPPETPIPSRRGSPALQGTPFPSSPRRRIPPPSPSEPPLPSFARRLSKPFIDIAVKASTPSVWVDFVVSLHPSLLAYFLVAVSSTISNKSLLRGFFQGITFLLTAWQMACATLGTMLSVKFGAYKPIKLTPKREGIMRVVALVFSLEIAASNLALRLVPVPFHVSVRAASPLLTLALSVLFFSSRTTLRTASSLLLVLLGISFTSMHEAWLSLGSLLVILSTVLLAAKSLLTTHLLSNRFRLHPLDVLARMSPLSMIHCALFAVANGEVQKLATFVQSPDCTREHLLEIVLNGVLSFGVVVLGLVAERRTRPPALAISSQAAQATTIVVSTLIFGLSMSPLNFLGVGLVLAGGVLYARYEAMDDDERNVGGGGGGGIIGGTNGSLGGHGNDRDGGHGTLLPLKVKRDDPVRSGGDEERSWWGGRDRKG